MAGYVAPMKQWKWLSRDWKKVRRLFRAPPYHATDCEVPPHGEFVGWTKARLLGLKKGLVEVIHQHTAAGVGRTVYVPDYDAVLTSQSLFAGWDRTFLPVLFCLHTCLEWVACTWPHRPSNATISVVVEQGTYGLGTAIDYFYWLRDRATWMAPYVSIAPGDKGLSPLQAADMLAFETWKSAERTYKRSPPLPERALLKALNKHERLDLVYANRVHFEALWKAYRGSAPRGAL